MKKEIDRGVAISVLVKVNPIWSLAETFDPIELARDDAIYGGKVRQAGRVPIQNFTGGGAFPSVPGTRTWRRPQSRNTCIAPPSITRSLIGHVVDGSNLSLGDNLDIAEKLLARSAKNDLVLEKIVASQSDPAVCQGPLFFTACIPPSWRRNRKVGAILRRAPCTTRASRPSAPHAAGGSFGAGLEGKPPR